MSAKSGTTHWEYDYLYLQVEREDLHQHLHNLTTVADERYEVTDIHSHTVVENSDSSEDRVSRSSVVLPLRPKRETRSRRQLNPWLKRYVTWGKK